MLLVTSRVPAMVTGSNRTFRVLVSLFPALCWSSLVRSWWSVPGRASTCTAVHSALSSVVRRVSLSLRQSFLRNTSTMLNLSVFWSMSRASWGNLFWGTPVFSFLSLLSVFHRGIFSWTVAVKTCTPLSVTVTPTPFLMALPFSSSRGSSVCVLLSLRFLTCIGLVWGSQVSVLLSWASVLLLWCATSPFPWFSLALFFMSRRRTLTGWSGNRKEQKRALTCRITLVSRVKLSAYLLNCLKRITSCLTIP